MASEERHSYEEAKGLLMPLLLKHRDLHGQAMILSRTMLSPSGRWLLQLSMFSSINTLKLLLLKVVVF